MLITDVFLIIYTQHGRSNDSSLGGFLMVTMVYRV